MINTIHPKLCHNFRVIRQCRKRWSTISPLTLYKMHQSKLSALKGLINCNMSLVFTLLYDTNQVKALILNGTLDFHKNLIELKETNLAY